MSPIASPNIPKPSPNIPVPSPNTEIASPNIVKPSCVVLIDLRRFRKRLQWQKTPLGWQKTDLWWRKIDLREFRRHLSIEIFAYGGRKPVSEGGNFISEGGKSISEHAKSICGPSEFVSEHGKRDFDGRKSIYEGGISISGHSKSISAIVGKECAFIRTRGYPETSHNLQTIFIFFTERKFS